MWLYNLDYLSYLVAATTLSIILFCREKRVDKNL